MKRIFGVMLALLLGLALSACGSTRTYTSVTTHVDQRVTEDDPSVLRAETYQELVSSILHFVSEGEETGTVRLYQYTGDVESDLESACLEVLEEEPLGAYALLSLEHTYTRIVSYYECEFTLVYRCTPEEIDAVSYAGSTVAFREQLQQSMDGFEDLLAVRTGLSLTEEQVLAMVTEYYYETPALALGFPSVTVNIYGGEENSQKIIEVKFDYGRDTETCLDMQAELLTEVLELLDEWEVTADAAGLRTLYRQLSAYPVYALNSSGSAYRFLITRRGSQEGAALALLLCCQTAGLETIYVTGTDASGEDAGWVMVELDGNWCHMDLALADDPDGCLHSDEEMLSLGYTWDQESYPVGAGVTQTDTSFDGGEWSEVSEFEEEPDPGIE